MVDEFDLVERGGAVLEVDLRFRVGEGEVELSLTSSAQRVVVFGPSGGGKSTLVRTLAGVERRARGRVAVQGRVWMDTDRGIRVPPWDRGVGWVPQDHLLFPHLDVRENLAYGMVDGAGVEEVARSLFVDHLLDRRPRRLSGGEQQRVAPVRALLRNPGFLLLDEPFSALDRPLRGKVGEAIRRFTQERQIPILLVTHDEADAAALAQEHWLLSRGRLERVT
jgi:molybdate transport system ATP-binding protein